MRQRQVQSHINDLINNSSLHGVSYIFDKGNPIRRVIWFLITSTAFVYSILKVHESTVHYLEYPFNTARTRKYVDEIDFPAVSFCNINDMRMSILNGTKVDAAILGRPNVNISGEEYRYVTKSAAHKLEEMLVDCKFNGRKCSVKNFTQFNWNEGDKCYTFNSGKEGHELLSISGSGVKRSLVLTLNVQHYDYYRDVMDAGIHVILHGQYETPVRMRGAIVSPGFSTYIEIDKKKMLNLKPPYKTSCGSMNLKYFEGYSMHTCWLEQLTDFLQKKCGCKDFFMPGNITICSLDAAKDCLWPQWEIFSTEKLCKCPVPCEMDSYHGEILSRALFPSLPYAKVLKKKLSEQQHMRNVDMTNTEHFMRDNLLRMVLYYDDLSYELLEQQPSYDTLVWLGDIGGQIGLFVGAGALSYFEFFDCLALIIYARFFQAYHPSPKL